jgi:hypothetical protein
MPVLQQCKEVLSSDKQLIGTQRGVLWNVDDYFKLQDFMGLVRRYNSIGDYESAFNLTTILNMFIRKTYDDHHPNLLHRIRVEALDADIHHNIITAAGNTCMVQILSNQSTRFFLWMSMGTSTVPEAIGQNALLAEVIRIPITTNGSVAAHGHVWNHVANLGYGPPTNTYYEFGIHDAAQEPSNMLSRSVLTTGLSHTQNSTFLTASHSTVFVSK